MVKKLCAIYNVWDDWDLLQLSIANIRPLVDSIIVVASHNSNYGETDDGQIDFSSTLFPVSNVPIYVVHKEPYAQRQSIINETWKRNQGLEYALAWTGATHFITMDADEFYDPDQFKAAKKYLNDNPHLNGLVVESYVYFKSPTLTIGKDVTLVPHIHKLTPTIKHEFNKQYPFAWEGKKIRIDPTRSLNINSGVEMFDCPMHHMSWVRKDPEKKVRNSTARANLQRSTILQDYLNAEEGYFCQFYQKRLVRVPNRFGIPEYGEKFNDENL